MKISILAALLILSPLSADSSAVEAVGPPLELSGADTYFMNPEWSPTGTVLAVTGQGYRGIYLLSFPDGDITMISEDPGTGAAIRWSPNGDRILTVVSKYENRRRYNAVAVFDIVSGQKNLLTRFQTDPTGTPRWSKDGETVFLVGEKDIDSLSAKSGVEQTQPPAAQDIVLSHGDNIIVHSLPAKGREIVETIQGHKLNLRVSPNGKKLVFEIMGGHLWVTSISGKNAVDLGTGYRPSWAPTSDRIAYMVTTDDGHRYLSSDIYVINSDGTGRINITSTDDTLEMNPNWSPDGSRIAYHTLEEGKILIQEVR